MPTTAMGDSDRKRWNIIKIQMKPIDQNANEKKRRGNPLIFSLRSFIRPKHLIWQFSAEPTVAMASKFIFRIMRSGSGPQPTRTVCVFRYVCALLCFTPSSQIILRLRRMHCSPRTAKISRASALFIRFFSCSFRELGIHKCWGCSCGVKAST